MNKAVKQFSMEEQIDLVVYGSTGAGIVHSICAARHGLKVILVSPVPHLGGMLSNGLTTMDTLYNGFRAPIYEEIRQAIHEYYQNKYGKNSDQYFQSLPGQPKVKVEAHVFEIIINRMISVESKITVVKSYFPVSIECEGSQIQSVTFRDMNKENKDFMVRAKVYSDCSYEGDLLAIAKANYQLGRESKDAFNEKHAGKIFMRKINWPPTPDKVESNYLNEYRKMNLVHYNRWYEIIYPESSGEPDKSVQAYNLRTIITRDSANRIPIEKPIDYDREIIIRRLKNDINWSFKIPIPNMPNQKMYLNLPEIVGAQNAFVEGDWHVRQTIINEHAKMTRWLIYFMQNDESLTEETRQGWREWGLPLDEFKENNNLPYEIYVRESRRLIGRAIFTENDAQLASHLKRAPICKDAISITDWFLDSHAVTPEKISDSDWEGELLLNNITVPGQFSYWTMIPEEIDNLLVPVCASSTHIGWGAIRLEPTWMSMAEAAGYATVMSINEGKTPATIEIDNLMRQLVKKGIMISFFNDVEVSPFEKWYPASQYFGAHGFFGSYDAQPLAALMMPLAELWIKEIVDLQIGKKVDKNELAQSMLAAEKQEGKSLLVENFVSMIAQKFSEVNISIPICSLMKQVQLAPTIRISRGGACQVMFAIKEILE
jgi:hypothetical protein